MEGRIMKLKSTQLFQNINELKRRGNERNLYNQIYDKVIEFVPDKINAIYLTTTILSTIRYYKF